MAEQTVEEAQKRSKVWDRFTENQTRSFETGL